MNQNSVKTKSVPLWHVCDRNTCTQSTSKGSNCRGLGYEIISRLNIREEVVNRILSGTESQAAFARPGPEQISLLVRKPPSPRSKLKWLDFLKVTSTLAPPTLPP